MRTVILVPRRAGVADRDRLWAFARTWWENDHPDWEIVEGHHDDGGPFNRSAAINAAAREAGEWDAALIIDADVLCDPHNVRNAIDLAVESGGMVLAYHERVALSRAGTEQVMRGYRGNWRARGMVDGTFLDACSSAVAVSRQLWDAVGGFDERFVGWGWEDVAFRIACETVSGREMAKIAGQCWHLHHRVSEGNNRAEPTFILNRARGERYRAARFDRDALAVLLAEAHGPTFAAGKTRKPAKTRIPRILHRTVPADTTAEVEGWWEVFAELHPEWELRTWRDPLDPKDFPTTAPLWDRCATGAQLAGLVRLEVLHRHGGVYVDSDVEPYRALDVLLHLPGFAAWEDARVIPDAVLGFEKGHPAVVEMLERACAAVTDGAGAWESGPGVTTSVLRGRHDVLLLPPGSFFPYHYSDKRRRRHEDHMAAQPWAFAAHHWAASWVGA